MRKFLMLAVPVVLISVSGDAFAQEKAANNDAAARAAIEKMHADNLH